LLRLWKRRPDPIRIGRWLISLWSRLARNLHFGLNKRNASDFANEAAEMNSLLAWMIFAESADDLIGTAGLAPAHTHGAFLLLSQTDWQP
jgi:hypothetical protein